MDKVIDGVDVSGCKHYRAEIETKMPYGEYEIQKDKCHYSGIEIIQNCKGNKGCIYKQLQRAREEIEDIKTEYEVFKNIASAECERARAENERLKEENYGLNQELLGYKKGVQASEIVELKYALQEIRDMADFKCALPSTELCHCKACDYADNIIAKINEVIGEK